MLLRTLPVFALLGAPAGCERQVRDMVSPAATYEPTRAGTIDRALCLLGYTAVPMRKLLTGHHLVDARLNGRAAAFVVDTGANASVLHAPFAGRFAIEPHAAGVGGAVGLGGALEAKRGAVGSWQVGPVDVNQRRILTADLSQLVDLLSPLSGGREIDGILGQDVLTRRHAVIDVAKPILYLLPQGARAAPVAEARCARSAEILAD